MAQNEDVFKKIVSHCKEYGFVFPSSEIYDGLWEAMTLLHDNIVGIDSAVFMHPTIWKASGHVDAFNDPLIDNRDSKKRYRADVLIEDQLAKFEEKMDKEVAKARKRFGDSFDEAMFRQTNPRVLENQRKWDELHSRFEKAMNDNNLEELKQIILDYKSSSTTRSSTPSAAPATGPMCASSTSCSRPRWAAAATTPWTCTCAPRQHRASS